MIDRNFKYGDRMARYMAEKHILELVDVIVDRDCKSIIERYNDLNVKFQNIHQRVSQHIIASLVMTTSPSH